MSHLNFGRQQYDDYGDEQPSSQDESPLFQRLNDNTNAPVSSNVSELQQYRQKLVQNQARIKQLERINTDLESRLEDQAKQCLQAERNCVDIEKKWRAKCERIEAELRSSQKHGEEAELKSERLREHLSRTERELYGLLQRKYELMRGSGQSGGSGGAGAGPGAKSWNASKGTTEDVSASGTTLASLLGFGTSTTPVKGPGARAGQSARARLSKTDTDIDQLYDLNSRQLHSKEIRQRRVLASLHDFLSGGT